jgi:hypothetical protein
MNTINLNELLKELQIDEKHFEQFLLTIAHEGQIEYTLLSAVPVQD